MLIGNVKFERSIRNPCERERLFLKRDLEVIDVQLVIKAMTG